MDFPERNPVNTVSENGDLLPLVTDLDGTLIATDTLLEGALTLVRRHPRYLPLLFVWLSRGKAVLKSEIAKRSPPDPAALPYRADVVEYLRSEREKGRRIVLATAANQRVADAVANHLDIFDEVLASTDSVNLQGARKRDELVKRFGARGFDYIGDSKADEPVWKACRIGYVAGSMQRLPASVVSAGTAEGTAFSGAKPTIKLLARAIRVHQWVKNVLVFVPTLLNHNLSWEALKAVGITFLGFSFVASGTYLANDLFDLEADRRHPRKCRRPLASGQISISQGILMAAILLTAGFFGALLVSDKLVLCLLIYLAVTTLYSTFLKGKPIIDVVALAMLYTLRVYTGGLVSQAYVSPWLFQFSVFLFLSLAFVKRYSELLVLRHQRARQTPGRGYHLRDLGIISQAGVGSGLLAGLVLALYVNDREIAKIYPNIQMLWCVCPLFVYWIIRVWLVAHRGNMHDDPILFAFRDKVSYIVGALVVIAVLLGLVPNV